MKNKTNKIAIIYSGAKQWGGIETYLELLFGHVDNERVDLTLISLGEWPLAERIKNKELRIKKFSGNRINLTTVFSIARYLKNNNFDLVVSQGTVANAYARAASLLSGVPSMVTVHSDSYYDYPSFATRVIYSMVEKLTRFPTKHYIAVSEYLKKKLIASGISADKITVIYNGVSLDSRFQIPNSIFNKPELVIGSIGRLHKVKNYAELIRACSKLKIKNWKLEIAGEGGERKQIEQLIVELGLTGKVELLGNVVDVQKALAGWDIYIQPSLSEGFGLTVVEAMLAGKPVIVSPYGSLPELVSDGKTGIVMKGARQNDMAEAISKMLSDKDKATQLALAGQKYALEHFTVDRFATETERVYQKLCQKD